MLWLCTGCTARYSVGAPRCPQCGSTKYVEEGAEMPKVTAHGGPTVDGFEVDQASGELTPIGEGGEDVSAGSSSSTSSEKEPSSPATSEQSSPSRARKTGSRSAKDQTATPDSTAGSAAGGRADGGSATGSDA